jgi:geranylgeranyl diphosphate synthase, type I
MDSLIPAAEHQEVQDYLAKRRDSVRNYITGFGLQHLVSEQHVKDYFLSYPLRGGKSLRPAFVALSAAAVSGEDEDKTTLPLQAAVELYHNWTLIHDDIIDEDDFRRGKPSLHREIEAAAHEMGAEAAKYGRDIALLIGDLMHSSVSIVLLRLIGEGVSPEVFFSILRILHAELTPSLVDGEAKDVRYSREKVGEFSDDQVIDMLEGKTAALFEFCGISGGLVGLKSPDVCNASVKALAGFSRMTGLAFQVQDDILGLVGDEDKLGKPRGSDLREGKHTLLLLHAYREGSENQLKALQPLVGKRDITPEEVDRAVGIMTDIGSIAHVNSIAREYLENALVMLEDVKESHARSLLAGIGKFMIEREF